MQIILIILKFLHKIRDFIPKSPKSQEKKPQLLKIESICPSIITDESLTKVAYSHAIWMRKNHKISHIGENGKTHMYRLKDTVYKESIVAEYIFYSPNEEMAISQLRERLNEKPIQIYRYIGIGCCDGYWCILLAK